MKVYLAGGMKTGWQDKVIAKGLPGITYLDPRSHGLTDPQAYTAWDLRAIEECDVVFAYMEDSNPGGYALGLEIGYAFALDKRIIFVNDMRDTQRSKYFAMIFECCDSVCNSIEDAVWYLLDAQGRLE